MQRDKRKTTRSIQREAVVFVGELYLERVESSPPHGFSKSVLKCTGRLPVMDIKQ
ncbi:hypothetical protein DPMN_108820 [Dreissena polymorpha]|uniref:Uncharacterized protein n=1 Tax=Dreissena polymorpha TaxID=45954 RepID=A0A9D4QME3_DREPO|nr:hypothetical protein DPMN_108820 [Dreissena polymorpha]